MPSRRVIASLATQDRELREARKPPLMEVASATESNGPGRQVPFSRVTPPTCFQSDPLFTSANASIAIATPNWPVFRGRRVLGKKYYPLTSTKHSPSGNNPRGGVQPNSLLQPPSLRDTLCSSAMNPLSMNFDNLASIKDDMVAFIAGHGIRRVPAHAGDDIPTIVWEDEANPDSWKDFVETAKAAGATFITMSDVVLEKEDVELLIEEVQEQEYHIEMVSSSSELDEAQSLVTHIGKVGHLQLGFPHQGIMFTYEASTEWYDRYQQLVDSVGDLGDIVFEDEDEDEQP